MKKLFFIFVFLFSVQSAAAGLQASFGGSRLSNMTRSSTIFEYDSTVDASGNLLDISGSNYLQNSEALSGTGWTVQANATILTNQVRCPASNALTAELITVGTSGSTAGFSQSVALAAGSKYEIAFYLKRVSTVGSLLVSHPSGDSYGLWSVDLSTVGDNWIQINRWTSYPAVTNEFTLDGSNNAGVYFTASSGTVQFYMCAVQLSKTDDVRRRFGIYHATTTTTKPLHDMAPTNVPTSTLTAFQNSDGQQFSARTFNGSDQRYSIANHASFNMFTADHTVTAAVLASSSGSGEDTILAHYGSITGFDIRVNNSHYATAYYFNGAGSKSIYFSTAIRDDKFHIIQVVRKSNIATLYLDGSPATPIDVTGYGGDVAALLALGMSSGAVQFFQGSVLYVRSDAEALSQLQLAKDRETIFGILSSSGGLYPSWTFSRSTSATSTMANGTIGYVAANIPRVGSNEFLIELQNTNYLLQSQTLGTTWFCSNCAFSINSSTILAPDGTATADGIIADSDNEAHFAGQTITTVASTCTYSAYLHAGNKNFANLAHNGVANSYAVFDVVNCNTMYKGAGALYYSATQLANGWCRVAVAWTCPAASGVPYIAPRQVFDSSSYAGDSATVNLWAWGAQLEYAGHSTSYIATTTGAATKTQDSLSMPSWRISKNLSTVTPTFAMYFDNDVCNTANCYTYNSEIGNYPFTVYGDTKHVESQIQNDYFSFDGTGDYLSTPTASGFVPSGNFSIIGIIAPASVTGIQTLISKHGIAGNYAWHLYLNGQNAYAARSTNGTDILTSNTANCAVIDKMSLITAAFSTTTGLTVRMDDCVTSATDATTTATYPGNANVSIAANNTPGNYYTGKIHNMMVLNGYAISQAEHNTMYAALKESNILPTHICHDCEHKKLYINFDYKASYSGAADIGATRMLLSISGNAGVSLLDKNYIFVYTSAGGYTFIGLVTNDSTTTRYIRSDLLSNYNVWNSYSVMFDLADLSRSTFFMNGVSAAVASSDMTGSDHHLYFTDSLIRIGQAYNGTTTSSGRYRNLSIRTAP